MLENVRIVLVSTSHTGNMGSAARAMKTMGLSDLCFVSPLSHPDGKSTALAAGAADVLQNAVIVKDLASAVEECALIIGTSARSRTLSWPMLSARECGKKLVEEAQFSKVALVFGREANGLTNEELQQCHFHVCIDANPQYSSLNLAAAVQTLCYEVRMSYLDSSKRTTDEESVYPLAKDLEGFYQHLEDTLSSTGFIRPNHPGIIMQRLRRLFNRARPDRRELNILRGMLSSVDKISKG
ncbi:MAG: tRNA (cytosine(32)/uridine(32)-2'-O)-methyltransferase TrmJ [Pseudomonadota bacterium]